MKTVSMEEVQAVVDLRYHFDEDGKLLLECYKNSINAIAKKLRLKPHDVSYRLQLFLKNKIKLPSPPRLTDSAVKHLTDFQTLQSTATLSLQSRVNLFNAQRPDRLQVRPSDLRALYKARQITFKTLQSKIRHRRAHNASTLAADMKAFDLLLRTVRRCERFGLELIMLDESTFSMWSYNKKAWAPKGINVQTSVFWRNEAPVACCAAVSSQRGLITFKLTDYHYNALTFLEFLRQLRAHIDTNKTVLLLDNCSIHTARQVQEYIDEQKINTVFNVPYCPQYNGIELFWAQAKRAFRAINTQIKTGTTQTQPFRRVVQTALLSVPDEIVKKCCQHAIAEIKRPL